MIFITSHCRTSPEGGTFRPRSGVTQLTTLLCPPEKTEPDYLSCDFSSAYSWCLPVGPEHCIRKSEIRLNWNMAFRVKNQTNPLTITATGYAPYIESRAARATQKGRGAPLTKAERNAQMVRDYWIRQDFYQDIKDYAAKHDRDLFRSRWECAADKKGLYSRVQWEVDKVTAKMDEELEKRRSRLAELLKSEEDMYLKESLAQHEDEETKTARMLCRYKELKMQKEAERQKMADEKKEQQFKRNCEELRTLMSKKIASETAEEGRRLRCERLAEAEEKNREEEIYAELWLKDTEAKQQREEKEEESRRQRDAEYAQLVSQQVQERRLEKQRKLREKETDAEIRAEQERLAGLEDEWQKQMKKRKQQEAKHDLDECLREKLKRKAKEVQDDLMQDLFFLKQIMAGEEEAKINEKKRALLKEQQDYLQHLRDQMRKEEEFEKKVDRMYQEELEKMWERRKKEWEEEKNKRRALEQDVMNGVKEQILANVEKGRQAQCYSQEYGKKVKEEDEEDRRKSGEKLRLIRERNEKHQRELLDQIRLKEERFARDQRLQDHDLEQLQIAREAEEAKVRNLLAEMKIDNEHSYRVARRKYFDECKAADHCCHTKHLIDACVEANH
ncbi:hypothetical protein AVEN_226477-1 [Araneus ventricosus]|uniref:Cilia- and flagella-associated protein 53 n=2 Tax=Araneidae TaxID=6913 RepID=A0A4Y2E2C4_ARAVE|nr:hypothetical protein AVEN_226477-1 [Araneus ventricosus]